ncbi:hypothetical protein X758_21790 [Mesorhizobium sp. LSHC416B00]|nr:hypothetical protein X761_04215 [Mesorhizobium sp. LSHC424B00]ESX68693.1 hypothetical protein X758_21790 [Mesorhizobium sp. LSHC416B00]
MHPKRGPLPGEFVAQQRQRDAFAYCVAIAGWGDEADAPALVPDWLEATGVGIDGVDLQRHDPGGAQQTVRCGLAALVSRAEMEE